MIKPSYDELLDFISEVDKDFPTPLSDKVDITEWTKKLLEKSTLCTTFLDGKIVSVVAGYTENLVDDIAYIAMVATRNAYRGKGYAQNNVKMFIEVCKEKHIPAVHLYVAPENEAAKKMYNSLGFVELKIKNEPRPNDIHLVYNN